jgi:putative heme transporter
MVALFAAVVFAVDQFVPGARNRLAHASAGWLLVSLCLELFACTSYVVLFQTVFSRPPWLVPVRRGVEIGLGELGAFAITPTGAGGPALRIWGLRSSLMPWRALIVRSISHGGVLNLPYVLAAAVLGIGVSLHVVPGHAPVLTALAPLGLVIVVVTIAAVASWIARRGPASDEASGRARIRSALTTIPEGLADLALVVRRPLPLVSSFGWWMGDCAALWAGFQAVGGSPSLSVLILAYMLGQLGNTLPLPGGVGGVEPLMLGIFSASGVNLGLAGAAVICYRAIALGVQGVLGVGAFVTLVGDVREQAARGTIRARSPGSTRWLRCARGPRG